MRRRLLHLEASLSAPYTTFLLQEPILFSAGKRRRTRRKARQQRWGREGGWTSDRFVNGYRCSIRAWHDATDELLMVAASV